MKSNTLRLFLLTAVGWSAATVYAQSFSSSSNLTAEPTTDCIVPFKLSEEGEVREVQWGADLAWISEENLRRCLAFMGEDNVEIVRTSFQPTYELVDDDLQDDQKTDLNERIRLLNLCSSNIKLALNCDHPSVDDWYSGNAENWAQLMDVTANYYQEAGFEIVSISPFNEPDYGWGQGSLSDFYNIAGLLRENSRFDDIRICGGNTLNCDQALSWYNSLKDRLDEGNTHQLAGTFDNFATFYTTVREDGNHATADEMHNVMEPMVGVEYGLQTGIWWGAAEYARGEFCKASHGERLAYAEHRDNWTAASVYRAPDGKVQAFGGTSERQGVTTSYRFLSKERDVFYDGHGPQREYVLELPGGESGSYQDGQTNAECVINITWGDDVQPVVDDTYVLLNKGTLTLLDISDGTPAMASYTANKKTQWWKVNPVDSRVGNDFSYHQIISASTLQTLDVQDYSLDSGADVILYTNGSSTNQLWYLEYVSEGWFRIRNRHSSLCLRATANSLTQNEVVEDDERELWRFIQTGIRPRSRTIDAPTNLKVTARTSSILLSWDESTATSPTYTVLRADAADGEYNIIARDVTETTFVDNKAKEGNTYYYAVRTIDASLNHSAFSDTVSAAIVGGHDIIARYAFDGDTNDGTININHAATPDTVSYTDDKWSGQAIELDGSDDFVQLPTEVADFDEITISAYFYWTGTTSWTRLFDFGNGEDENMFLTLRSESGTMRFAIKNGGDEQQLDGEDRYTVYRNTWVHVAVTLGEEGATLYVDGQAVASSADITIKPSDFHPLLNYIGRSQYSSDPLFAGYIDDFRIYNYAMSAEEVAELTTEEAVGIARVNDEVQATFTVGPTPADTQLEVNYSLPDGNEAVSFGVYDLQGHLLLTETGENGAVTTMQVSGLSNGVYVLKAQCGKVSDSLKFTVRH